MDSARADGKWSTVLTKLAADLRRDLVWANYSVDAASQYLAADEISAAHRGLTRPASRVLARRAETESLATADVALLNLLRLFVVGDVIDDSALKHTFPNLGIDGAVKLELVERVTKGWRAALSLTPYRSPANVAQEANWWFVSDLDDHLRQGPAATDHVMGIGSATRTLLATVPSERVAKSLDLGTGCGIIAHVLALHSEQVVATDISSRALRFAAINAQLNEVQNIEFRHGDLLDPVQGERFDRIATNPPFVVTPAGAESHHTYRSSHRAGDTLLQELVEAAPAYLTDHGTLHALGNWEIPWGSSAEDHVSAWANRSAASAWFIERDRQTPLEYAELWARDGGVRVGNEEYAQLVESWIDDFAERRISSIGFGMLLLLAPTADTQPVFRYERAPGRLHRELDFGNFWLSAFRTARILDSVSDAELIDQRFVKSDALREIRGLVPGTGDIVSIALAQSEPLERTLEVDTFSAALIGACDGELTPREVADALSGLLDVPEDVSLQEAARVMREFVWIGFATRKPPAPDR